MYTPKIKNDLQFKEELTYFKNHFDEEAKKGPRSGASMTRSLCGCYSCLF